MYRRLPNVRSWFLSRTTEGMRTIFQSGSDVYIYGDVVGVNTDYRSMVYWKNGMAHYPIGRRRQTSLT